MKALANSEIHLFNSPESATPTCNYGVMRQLTLKTKSWSSLKRQTSERLMSKWFLVASLQITFETVSVTGGHRGPLTGFTSADSASCQPLSSGLCMNLVPFGKLQLIKASQQSRRTQAAMTGVLTFHPALMEPQHQSGADSRRKPSVEHASS